MISQTTTNINPIVTKLVLIRAVERTNISLLLISHTSSNSQNSIQARESEMAATRTVMRSASIFLSEPSRPLHFTPPSSSFSLGTRRSFTHRLYCNVSRVSARGFHFPKRTVLNCSHDETQSTSSSNQDGQGPPQEAVLKAISGFYLTLMLSRLSNCKP